MRFIYLFILDRFHGPLKAICPRSGKISDISRRIQSTPSGVVMCEYYDAHRCSKCDFKSTSEDYRTFAVRPDTL